MAKEEKNRILSKVLGKGRVILEAIYRPKEHQTLLAVADEGTFDIKADYTDEMIGTIYPISVDTDYLKNQLVRLPSDLVGYEGSLKLYEKVRDFIGEYMKVDPDFLTVSAVYVLMTWVYDKFRTIPYLRVIGTYNTGKSRFLDVMAGLSYKGMLCGGSTTTSAMFRLVDMVQGTLVFDEADFQNSETWSDIVKVLNSGFTRGGTVTRTEKQGRDGGFAPRTFSVFTPKILASRTRFKDEALESRCLTCHLYPQKSVDRPVHLPDEFEDRAEAIRNQLLAFRFDTFQKIKEDESSVEGVANSRLRQMALALASVAKIISPEVHEEVLNYLKSYETDLQAWLAPDLEADIVFCIAMLRKDVKVEEGKVAVILMEEISKYFNAYLAEASTADPYGKDKVTARKVGSVVKDLHLRKKRVDRGWGIPLDSRQMKAIDQLITRFDLEKLIKESTPSNTSTPKVAEDTDDIPF